MPALTPQQKDRAVELLEIIVRPSPVEEREAIEQDHDMYAAMHEAALMFGHPAGPEPRKRSRPVKRKP